jgi:hypothetical protein
MAVPPKCGVELGRNGRGHESKLDKGPDADIKHGINESIDILKVKGDPAINLVIDKHVIVKETVKSDVLVAKSRLNVLKVLLPVVPEAFSGAASSRDD